MEIYGAGGTQGPQPIYPRLAAFSVDAGQTVHAGAPRDHVEISPLGQMLDGISQLPEIRHEKVEEIRRQIAAGLVRDPREARAGPRPPARRTLGLVRSDPARAGPEGSREIPWPATRIPGILAPVRLIHNPKQFAKRLK